VAEVAYGTALCEKKGGRIIDATLAHDREEAERIVARQNERERDWDFSHEWVVVEIRPVTEPTGQGPITDAVKEQIEFNESKIAWTENNFLPGPYGAAAIAQYEYAIEQLREALEAAERAHSDVPSTTAEQEKP
jgi:hypothetical protein